jgi:hypothetical protein
LGVVVVIVVLVVLFHPQTRSKVSALFTKKEFDLYSDDGLDISSSEETGDNDWLSTSSGSM